MTALDGSYKHIFFHPQIICDLLTGFVRESQKARWGSMN